LGGKTLIRRGGRNGNPGKRGSLGKKKKGGGRGRRRKRFSGEKDKGREVSGTNSQKNSSRRTFKGVLLHREGFIGKGRTRETEY